MAARHSVQAEIFCNDPDAFQVCFVEITNGREIKFFYGKKP